MTAVCLPEIDKAVDCFLAAFNQPRALPFLSDAETELLFGREVTEALAFLDDYNLQKQICVQCRKHCCTRVRCEFYDSRFSRCPVASLRPALCRLHYCEFYNTEHRALVKRLGDIFLEGLARASAIDPVAAAFYDCPPFTPHAPLLVSNINLVLEDIRKNLVFQTDGFKKITLMIQACYPGS